MINFPPDPRARELQLLIERAKYERFVLRETTRLIREEFERVVDIMLSRRFRDLSDFQQRRTLQRFAELSKAIRVHFGEGYSRLSEFHVKEMRAYAELESEIARAQAFSVLPSNHTALQSSVGAFLPSHTIRSIAALPIQGLKLGDWFEGQARTMSLETKRIIQQGLIEGKSPLAISRRIVAPDSAEGPVLRRRAINEARAISRTTVNAVQNHAAIESYAKLPDSVVDSYTYTAVRDSRTSTICRALDGRVFRLDDPKRKEPPQHLNCRSSVIPVVKGVDPALRKNNPNAAPSFASYNAWLKSQPEPAQNRILGKYQAEQWRAGRMTLADAIDEDGRVLKLSELRAKIESRFVGSEK